MAAGMGIHMAVIANLCYIIRNGKILLIKKKTGISAGVWNGPGGKIEKDETLEESVKREVFEEVNVVPEAPKRVGELKFFYGDEEWIVHVFTAADSWGIEKETNEAMPRWFSLSAIPYEQMWDDDRIWMPLMLAGKRFRGEFYFNKETHKIVRHEIEEVS